MIELRSRTSWSSLMQDIRDGTANVRLGRKLTINLHHTVVKISMLLHQHLWVPGSAHEKCVNTRVDWDHEAAGNLKSNEEAVNDNNSGECTAFVIGRIGDVEVDVCNQGAAYSNEHASKGEDWTDEAFCGKSACAILYQSGQIYTVDKSINAAILDHSPGLLGRGKVAARQSV